MISKLIKWFESATWAKRQMPNLMCSNFPLQVHLFADIVTVPGILLVWQAGVVAVHLQDITESMHMLPTFTPGWSKLLDFKFNILSIF